jgi:hypothetical protein
MQSRAARKDWVDCTDWVVHRVFWRILVFSALRLNIICLNLMVIARTALHTTSIAKEPARDASHKFVQKLMPKPFANE